MTRHHRQFAIRWLLAALVLLPAALASQQEDLPAVFSEVIDVRVAFTQMGTLIEGLPLDKGRRANRRQRQRV